MSKNLMKTKNPISPELLKQLKGLYRTIKKARGIIIAGHINPDGDDICSQLALGTYLNSIGKRSLVLAEDNAPRIFSFLPDVGLYRSIHGLKEKLTLEEYDLVIVVDSGDFDRIGDVRKVLPDGITVVNIDHHQGNTGFGNVNIVAEKACSIGEILYYFFQVNSIPITYPLAVHLYVSIVTDTGSFKFDNMHSEVHLIAAELMDKGVRPSDFTIHLFQNKNSSYMKLLSTMLSRMEIVEDGRIAVSTLKISDFENDDENDTDGLIDYLGMVDTVSVYILIKEKEEGLVTASIRSKYSVDVSSIAAEFGGGGHIRAAGCKTKDMSPDAFRSRLIQLIKDRLPNA